MSIPLEDLAAVVALGLLCWVLRATFVLLVPADRLPAVVAQALNHLAPAALASIIAVELTSAVEVSDLACGPAVVGSRGGRRNGGDADPQPDVDGPRRHRRRCSSWTCPRSAERARDQDA